MESLNSILLTRLTRFNLSELAELYKRAGSATAVIEHKRDIREILPEASTHLIQALKDIDSLRKWAEQELEYDRLHNIEPICMNDERYPQRLKECPDAPILLYYLGNADLNNRHVINIIGTRHCTTYGQDIIRSFVRELKALCPDVLILSGLAYGVDIHAHRAALENGFETVGVLAHGLDDIYPVSQSAEDEYIWANVESPHGKAHSAAARCAIVYTNDPKRRRKVLFANLCTLLHPHVCPDEEKCIVAPTAAFVRHAKVHFVRVPMVRVRLSVRHTAGKRMPIPVPTSSTSWQPGAPRGYRGTIMARRQQRPKARRARQPQEAWWRKCGTGREHAQDARQARAQRARARVGRRRLGGSQCVFGAGDATDFDTDGFHQNFLYGSDSALFNAQSRGHSAEI